MEVSENNEKENKELVNILGEILKRNIDNRLTLETLNGIMLTFKNELTKIRN